MHEYGSDILYALKLKPWLRSNSVSRFFYEAIGPWTLFSNNSDCSRTWLWWRIDLLWLFNHKYVDP